MTRRVPLVPALLVVLGLAGAIALQGLRERRYPQIASPVDELYFGSDAVGRMALSFKSVLADVYWIRAIQYFAATRLQNRPVVGDDLLYPLLDVTTTLDPAFNIAYRFGATFLSEKRAAGLGRPDLAVKLLDKGFVSNPTKWQYLYDKAFIYYWHENDYRTAAHWFAEAAKVPGSADWLPGLAAYMLVQGGDRQSSRFMFQQLRDSAEHEYMRKNAQHRLDQLDLLDLIDRLNLVLARYERETGTRAMTWEPLIARGYVRRLPADQDGVPLVIDPASGRATVDRKSKYYPLPNEPEPARRQVPPAPPSPQGPAS
jgi:tetratricopeptide (TPR) repeat protein